MFTDCFPIDSISLQTSTGQELANLQAVQVYTKVLPWLATHVTEYSSRGGVYNDYLDTNPESECVGCQPSTVGIARTTAQFQPSIPSECQITTTATGADATATPSAFPANDVSGTDRQYSLAPQMLITSVVDDQPYCEVLYKIPFSAFVGTILAMDKDLYFHQNLQLMIYWKPINNWAVSTAGVAGAGSFTPLQTGDAAGYPNSLFMYLAQDINDTNVRTMSAQVQTSGMSLLVPWTISRQLTTLAAIGLYTMSTQLTPGMGDALKRIVTIPVNHLNTLKLSANTFNVRNIKYSSVQSSMDGRPIQDEPLTLELQWNYLYDLIKNSPIGLSRRTFHANSFWLDNFSDCDDSTNFAKNDLMESGLRIDQPHTYEIQFNVLCSGGVILHQYLTVVRRLNITAAGAAWAS